MALKNEVYLKIYSKLLTKAIKLHSESNWDILFFQCDYELT